MHCKRLCGNKKLTDMRKVSMYYQNISAALAHTRTVKNPFMFYSQHIKYREKAPPKKSKRTFCITHNYYSSEGNVPSNSECVLRIWRLTETRAIRAAHLFVPCVFVSQHPVSYSWFWGFSGANTFQSPWTEKQRAEKETGCSEHGIWGGKKMTFGDKVKNEFMYLDVKRRWNANQTIWRKEREREAGGSGRAIVWMIGGGLDTEKERKREMKKAREGGISLRGDVFVLSLSLSLCCSFTHTHTPSTHIWQTHTACRHFLIHSPPSLTHSQFRFTTLSRIFTPFLPRESREAATPPQL